MAAHAGLGWECVAPNFRFLQPFFKAFFPGLTVVRQGFCIQQRTLVQGNGTGIGEQYPGLQRNPVHP